MSSGPHAQQETSQETRPRKGRRRPRRATAEHLRNWALHYLERYAASSAHLRRLMQVKLERSRAAHGAEATAGADALEALIGRLQSMGLLDDAAFARGRARALHRRGSSARAIRAALAQKGVAAETVETALAALAEEAEEPELAAALAYARRRRLGPYRADASQRAALRERDLAALGRRGFGYEVARRVIEAEDPEALEAEASTRAAPA